MNTFFFKVFLQFVICYYFIIFADKIPLDIIIFNKKLIKYYIYIPLQCNHFHLSNDHGTTLFQDVHIKMNKSKLNRTLHVLYERNIVIVVRCCLMRYDN